jgi:hypothetical protein
MPNRTVQVLGSGFGSSPASVVATWNGSQVFSGTVFTQSGPVPELPNLDIAITEPLFTFEIPMDTAGNISMTTSVTGSPVVFTLINANYANVANTAGNITTWQSSGPNVYISIDNTLNVVDTRSVVSIDNVSQAIPSPKPSEDQGVWWWTVPAGSTLSCQVAVDLGLE